MTKLKPIDPQADNTPGLIRSRLLSCLRLTTVTTLFLVILYAANAEENTNEKILYTYDIVNKYPHDPAAFTQGLVYSDGKFFESTGLWGQSSLRDVDLESGKVRREHKLDNQYFGEGLELIGNKLYQLTWKSGLLFIYESTTFELIETHKIAGDGWGLTEVDGKLVKSDGSSRLTFMDPGTLKSTQIIEVTDGNYPVDRLNELELVGDLIYANIYQTDLIVMISPATGKVVGTLDLSGLLAAANHHGKAGVLNGIAYDEDNDRLFVTGKNWPWLFEIKTRPMT